MMRFSMQDEFLQSFKKKKMHFIKKKKWQEMKDEERLSFLHCPYANRKTVKLSVI